MTVGTTNGSFLAQSAVSGGSLSATVSNTSNTASATAHFDAIVAGGTAADAYFASTVTGGQTWTWGVDNSDSDAWVLSANASLGTTNVIHVASTGEITMPLQPAFLAFLGTVDSNVTGDGTTFTLGSGNALTEVYDVNGDFVTTGTFTAPVTGIYNLYMQTNVTGLSAAMTGRIDTIVTSNRSYQVTSNNPFNDTNLIGGGTSRAGVVPADMDAADTATFTTQVSGDTLTADVRNNTGTTYRTFVWGALKQ